MKTTHRRNLILNCKASPPGPSGLASQNRGVGTSALIISCLLLALTNVEVGFAQQQPALAGDLIVNLESGGLSAATGNVWTNNTINPLSPGNFTLRSGSTLPLTTIGYNAAGNFSAGTVTALNVNDIQNNTLMTASASSAPSEILGNGTVTVESWFYDTSLNNNDTILCYGQNIQSPAKQLREFGYGTQNHTTGIGGTGGSGMFGGYFGGDTAWGNAVTLTANTLHQAVFEYDGTNVYGFVDGVEVRTNSVHPLITAADRMTLGQRSNNGGNQFHGAIINCRVMSGLLTPLQVTNDFNLGPQATYLLVPLAPTASFTNAFIGDVVTLTDTNQAYESVSYQWWWNGGTNGANFTAISGATSSTYAFNSAGLPATNNYQFNVVVTGNSSGIIVTSPPVVISLSTASPGFVATQITPTNPPNLFMGYSVTFSATPGGNQPTTNYWLYSPAIGGPYTVIPGVNSNTLALTDLQLTNTGFYEMAVSNAYGGGVSSPVTLTVQPLSALPQVQIAGQLLVNLEQQDLNPAIDVWTNEINGIGDFTTTSNVLVDVVTNVYNSAAVLGLGVFGNSGQTMQSALQIPLGQTGSGTASVEAWLYTTNVPSSGNNPVVYYGSESPDLQRSFDYTSSGSGAFSGYADDFAWTPATLPTANAWHYVVYTYDGTHVNAYQDGVLSVSSSRPNLNTAQSPLTVGGTPFGDNTFNGFISAVRAHSGVLSSNQIANNYIAGPLQQVSIVVGPATIAPTNFDYYGDTVTLSVMNVQSLLPLDYQWQTDNGSGGATWSNVAGQMSTNYVLNTYTLPSVSAPTNLMYQLVVMGGSISVTSAPVTMTLNPTAKPAILADTSPLSATVYQGNQMTFTASFSGNQPVTNQWQISTDGGVTFTNLIGDSDTNRISILTIYNLQVSQSAEYRLLGGNAFGSTNSTPAILTVLPASAQPQVVSAGSMIADLEEPDLTNAAYVSTGTWHNESLSASSVGDFTEVGLNVLSVSNLTYNYQPINALAVSGTSAKAVASANQVPVGITANGAVSVEAWVYPTGTNQNSTAVCYGIQGGGSAPLEEREFNYNIGNNGALSGDFGNYDAPWTAPETINTWHYLAWTYDGTTSQMYVDGVQDTTHVPGSALLTVQTVLAVGTGINGSSLPSADPFQGYIASARVYTGVLTLAQVQNNYGAGPAAVASVSVRQDPAVLSGSYSGGTLTLTYSGGSGVLVTSTNVLGPWTVVNGAVSPFVVTPSPTNPAVFYRSY
jgi:hypothetical protein